MVYARCWVLPATKILVIPAATFDLIDYITDPNCKWKYIDVSHTF